jgi:hypothetical protein
MPPPAVAGEPILGGDDACPPTGGTDARSTLLAARLRAGSPARLIRRSRIRPSLPEVRRRATGRVGQRRHGSLVPHERDRGAGGTRLPHRGLDGIPGDVWGGQLADPPVLANTGGIYDPATNSWTATTTTGGPSARSGHSAIWTGSKMIVWGGSGNTGAIYDPATDSWTPSSTIGAPSPRGSHAAVWTGTRMIVWGGMDGAGYLDTGGIYDPATDSWTTTTTAGAPTPRLWHTAVWSGSRMVSGGESAPRHRPRSARAGCSIPPPTPGQ